MPPLLYSRVFGFLKDTIVFLIAPLALTRMVSGWQV